MDRGIHGFGLAMRKLCPETPRGYPVDGDGGVETAAVEVICKVKGPRESAEFNCASANWRGNIFWFKAEDSGRKRRNVYGTRCNDVRGSFNEIRMRDDGWSGPGPSAFSTSVFLMARSIRLISVPRIEGRSQLWIDETHVCLSIGGKFQVCEVFFFFSSNSIHETS